MPFYGDERYYGVLTLERPSGQPFTNEEAMFCHSVASLLFPALEIKRKDDRLLILKIWDVLKDQLVKLFGPHYLGRKLLIMAIAAVVIFFVWLGLTQIAPFLRGYEMLTGRRIGGREA